MSSRKARRPEGVEVRHRNACRTRQGGRCNCTPSHRGKVTAPDGRRLTSPWFPTEAAAVNWRFDRLAEFRSGAYLPPTEATVADAAEALVAGMVTGAVLDRSGKPYKPATCRSYEQALRSYAVPRLGRLRLSDVTRRDVQGFVDALRAEGLSPSTVVNKLNPLQVIFRRAVARDGLRVDPTEHLELPAVRGRRERVESPERAAALVAALPEVERPFWLAAFYAGLRRGELRALRWRDVDLAANVIRVERGWDDKAGAQEGKSTAGRRAIPLAGALRRELVAHKLRTGRDGDDLVFGRTAALPFVPSTVRARALRVGMRPSSRRSRRTRHATVRPHISSPAA